MCCPELDSGYFSIVSGSQNEEMLKQVQHDSREGYFQMNNYTILLVDDEVNILNSLYRVFRKEGYEILSSDNTSDALDILRKCHIHLILSDYRMPDMDGVTFLREAMKIMPDAIRIILSGYAESSAIISAINDGGIYKFITKPWDDDMLRIEVRHALERYELENTNRKLIEEVKIHNEALKKANQLLIEKIDEIEEGVVSTIGILNYISRTKYSSCLPTNIEELYQISQEVGSKSGISEEDLKNLHMATKLHDIGNIGVDFSVLNKRGALTTEERKEVERHPVIGATIISFLKGFDSVTKIIRHHHEYYNGSGYPDGLKGDDIPLSSRIIHIIDVYDSLTSDRPYRPALPTDEVKRILEKGRGTMFDPKVLDTFFEAIDGR